MVKSKFNSLFSGLIDIVYPKTCVVCKKKITDNNSADGIICLHCRKTIAKNNPPFCHCCGRRLIRPNFIKNLCISCYKSKAHFDRAFSPCIYEGAVKELIHEFKYKNKDYLGEIISNFMVDFIKEYNLPMDYIDLIVPVPLHKSKLREREFNQARILGDHIGSKFNKLVLDGCLTRTRATKTQTELAHEERFENVRNSFSVKDNESIRGKNILLVDDVLTTGATCSEAALTLKNSGAGIVFVLTAAN